MSKEKKNCLLCDTEFFPIRKWQEFCTDAHRELWYKNVVTFFRERILTFQDSNFKEEFKDFCLKKSKEEKNA